MKAISSEKTINLQWDKLSSFPIYEFIIFIAVSIELLSTVFINVGLASLEPSSDIGIGLENWKENLKLLFSPLSIPIATTKARLSILKDA